MTVFNPSYLVQSRHGIWYFQMQVPPDFRKKNSRTLIRRSLRTRDRNVALSRSKFWYLKVVELDEGPTANLKGQACEYFSG